MLHSLHRLLGYSIGATDGEIGHVTDFCFDDKTWNVRYLVVETGNWLFGRKVLISPVALQQPNWDQKTFPVNLTKEQVKSSPDVNLNQPLSLEQTEGLYTHYSWPYPEESGIGFMTSGMVGGVVAPGIPLDERISDELHQSNSGEGHENHLHGVKHTTRYDVQGADGLIGEATDFLVDENWHITSLVVDAGSWFNNKKIQLDVHSIQRVERESSAIYYSESLDLLKGRQEFNYNAV
ncbi:MAG: PRC-barrel domain-containing protein [Arcticibacter sp.]